MRDKDIYINDIFINIHHVVVFALAKLMPSYIL